MSEKKRIRMTSTELRDAMTHAAHHDFSDMCNAALVAWAKTAAVLLMRLIGYVILMRTERAAKPRLTTTVFREEGAAREDELREALGEEGSWQTLLDMVHNMRVAVASLKHNAVVLAQLRSIAGRGGNATWDPLPQMARLAAAVGDCGDMSVLDKAAELLEGERIWLDKYGQCEAHIVGRGDVNVDGAAVFFEPLDGWLEPGNIVDVADMRYEVTELQRRKSGLLPCVRLKSLEGASVIPPCETMRRVPRPAAEMAVTDGDDGPDFDGSNSSPPPQACTSGKPKPGCTGCGDCIPF